MSVTENRINFNDLERDVFNQCCRLGREAIKELLEGYDEALRKGRPKSGYRNKGLRQTTIKTIVGEVEYSRTIYLTTQEDGFGKYVYLLDEAMGIGGSGFMSGLLSGLIAKAACEAPYRSAARTISEATGQSISHTTAWNVVQGIGKQLDTQEADAGRAATANKGRGKLETEVLFEEMDGIWLHLQGKSRKEHGRSREMKLAIAYDGTEETSPGRHRLTNKVACAGFLPADEFMERKEGVVAGTFNTDEIKMRFLGGDGASWIRGAETDETVHFQLDVYHINQAIRTNVANHEMRRTITELLYAKKIDELLSCIAIMADSVSGGDERDGLMSLHTYFNNNRDGLIPCHRRGLAIPPPPEGKSYRRLGAMESNVFTLIGNRMKGRRFCWGIDGGNNLARLLCLKATDRLTDALKGLTAVSLPERYADEVTTVLSAAKIAQSTGKGYDGYHKTTAPPTPDYKWLRGIGKGGFAHA